MNMNFGKLTDGVLVYAPDVIRVGDTFICTPTANDYFASGWLEIREDKPLDKVGVDYIPDGWEARDGAICRVWREEPITPPVKQYKVEEIVYGLINRNALQGVKQIVGDYWELLTMRDTISANNEIFLSQFDIIKPAIVAAGVMTAEDVDAVMRDAEV